METHRGSPFFSDGRQRMVGATGQSLSPQSASLPELRLVLLGRKGAGKSSAGNTILSLPGGFETGKPTEECVKRRAEVAGKRVTIVDTPGWEWYYPVNGTPGWVRRETMRSMSLCPPGPHVILLVVRSCTSVTSDYHQQIEEYLELLGKTVWDHTFVLFTRGDELGSVTIEERIKNGGKAFQSLLQRCGNRFHVLENKRRIDDGTQVKELMSKMDKLVEERSGRYYEIDLLHLELEGDSKRRARERRKKQRLMEAQTQRGTIRSVLMNDSSQVEDLDEKNLFSRGSRRFPELRLILLGERETGKSSAGNAILGGPRYFQSGEATEECSRQQAEVSHRLVTVVDVPGWEGGPEGTTPERVKREIGLSVTLCPPGPHAFLLALRVDAIVQAPAVREHLELLGETVWRHTLLLFTRGDQLRQGVTIEQHIQGGGKDLHWLMERCSNRFHVISSTSCLQGQNSTEQITGLLEKIEKMVAGNRCEAFLPLVHEIQELGRQKNEKFQLKVKEFTEKLQRQEEELKKMKEREVKSIRWFFDRRKKDKVQSPGKTEREEVPYRGEDDRKSIMGELEEKMAWLTEDREREIQELTTEMSRVMAALHQEHREKERLEMSLEERDLEREELKEKVDDLQIKLLELERMCVVKEQERKEKELEFQQVYQTEVNELGNKLVDAENKNEALKRKAEETQKKIDAYIRYEEETRQKQQEMESKLKEKDNKIESILIEIKEVTLKNDSREREQCEKDKNREKNMDKLKEVIDMMTKEMEQLQMLYQEQVKMTEGEREMHENVIEKYNTLTDKLVGKDEEIAAIRQEQEQTKKQKEEELHRNVATQEKLQKKEEEINTWKQRHLEKDKEIETLRQNIDEKQKDIEKLKEIVQDNNEECASKLKHFHEEFKVKEAEIHKLIQSHTEKDKEIDTLRQNMFDKQSDIEKLKDTIQKNIEESATQLKHLEEQLISKEQEITKLGQTDLEKKKEVDIMRQNINEKQRDIETAKDTLKANMEESAAKLKHLQDEINVKDDEMDKLRHRDLEKDREMNTLHENIQEKQKAIEKLKVNAEKYAAKLQHLEEESEVKIEAYRRKNKLLEEELERIKNQNEENVRLTEEETRLATEKTENIINQLKQQHTDTERNMEKLKQQNKEDQERNNILQNAITELEKKCQELTFKCESYENALQAQREAENRREDEIKEMLSRYETQKTKDALSLEQMKELEQEMDELKQVLEELNKKEKQKEKEINEIKVYYENKSIEQKEQDIQALGREEELYRREQEVKKRQDNLEDRLKKLEQNKQELVKREDAITKKENELTDEKQELDKRTNIIRDKEEKLENECQNYKHMEADLEKIKREVEKRHRELTDMEEKLKVKEQQIKCEKEELERAWEKIETKQKEMKDQTEKHEKHLENLRQQLEMKERELLETETIFVKEQHRLKEEEKSLELLKANLEIKENELKKQEQQLIDANQLWEVKIQEFSKSSQEVENNKHDIEKWQAELSNKEHELLQKINGLQKKEQELVQREQDLAHKMLTEQNQDREKLLKSIKEELGSREQELIKGEEALCQREHKLKTKEINLDKRQEVVQNKEERLQSEREQNKNILQSLKEQQDGLKDKQHCLDTKETKLHHLETELTIRHDNITEKEQFLQNRELDLKEKTQTLEVLQKTLERKEKEVEESKNQLELKTRDLSNEADHLKKKREELEKWEKFLYNTELTLIHKKPFSGYQRWTNCAEFNGKQEKEDPIYRLHQDVDGDAKDTSREAIRRQGVGEQHIQLENANNILVKSWNGNGTLKDKQLLEDSSDEDDFESSSTCSYRLTQGIDCAVSELRLMLLGDTWSSHHTAIHILLGPDTDGGDSWRGEISGRKLTIVAHEGLKWRSGTDHKGTFQKHISESVPLCQPGPHAFILLIPAYVSFTGQYRLAVERTMSVLGEGAWGHTIVLFTWGEILGESCQQHVKRNGDLEWLVRKCGNRCHVLDNRHQESHVVKLLEKVEEMLAGQNERYYKMD